MKRFHNILTTFLTLSFFLLLSTSYSQEKVKEKAGHGKSQQKSDTAGTRGYPPLDMGAIERITGMKGKENKGAYKITVPQNDLKVEVDGFKIIPAMGLGSWAAFTPAPGGAMVMGDIILTENDVKPVEQEVIRQGLSISAIHNHFIRNHPNVVYMHVGGMGPTGEMAQKIKAVFEAVKHARGHDPASFAPADSVVTTLDAHRLDGIIGDKGEWSKGVYKYTIGRPDVDLQEHGVRISSFLGFNTWAAWQGTTEHAAVAGDFTMLEGEVAGVVRALVESGIEVVAVHNHMVHEQPRIFFLHYWGVGPADQLAKGLKAALEQTGKQQGQMQEMGSKKHG